MFFCFRNSVTPGDPGCHRVPEKNICPINTPGSLSPPSTISHIHCQKLGKRGLLAIAYCNKTHCNIGIQCHKVLIWLDNVFNDQRTIYLFGRMLYWKKVSEAGCKVTLVSFLSLLCVFSNASSNCSPVRTHSHIGYIYLTFLHCVFSNASSNGLH